MGSKVIQTVLGWVDNNKITAALPHEHVLSDLRPIVAPLDNGVFYDKVSLKLRRTLKKSLCYFG